MLIYLPIAEMAVPAGSILLLGAVVGFLSGMFGVGGGFLTTPFLIFMGLPPAVAVGTQANQLVAVSASGVLGHLKRGNVDIRLAVVMFAGSMFGTFTGVFLFRFLQSAGQIDLVIPVLYVLLLGIMGLMMLVESLSALLKKKGGEEKSRLAHHPFFLTLPYKMKFPQSRMYISALVPIAIGFVGGVLVSVLGVGGGFILVPAMIYILGMPILLVTGTSMLQILMTSVFAAFMHAITSHTVDVVLAAMLVSGGMVGTHFGMRAARHIKGVHARILLAVMLLGVAVQLAGSLLVKPDDLYSVAMRQ